jgi:hypothetical protein
MAPIRCAAVHISPGSCSHPLPSMQLMDPKMHHHENPMFRGLVHAQTAAAMLEGLRRMQEKVRVRVCTQMQHAACSIAGGAHV